MDRLYRGYLIESEFGHVRVTNLDNPNDTWTEDTVEDAERSIDELLDEG